MEFKNKKNNILPITYLILLIIIIYSFFYIPGCIEGENDKYAAQYANGNVNVITMTDTCHPGKCYCISCNIHNYSLSWLKKLKNTLMPKGSTASVNSIFPSLYGEECGQKVCNSTTFMEDMKNDSKEVLQVGLGMGSTAFDFNQANPWCANRLKYAVEWTTTQDYIAYPKKIDPEIDECLLNHDVIPIRLLYSDGKEKDYEHKIENYIKEYKDIGPVIFGTEADPSLDISQIRKTMGEIDILASQWDRKYKIGLSLPSDNITKAVSFANSVLEGTSYEDKVDYVLIGIRINEHQNFKQAFDSVLALSRYIMYRYNKPTIITYINLGDYPEQMQQNIQYFFNTIVPSLAQNDVIGASFYTYSGMFDPLQLGGRQGSLITNIDTIKTFGGYCSNYITSSDNTPYGGIFAIFPNSSRTTCNFGTLAYGQMTSASGFNSYNPNSAGLLKLEQPIDKLFECASCKDVNYIQNHDITDRRGNLMEDINKRNGIIHSNINCSNHTEINMYAEINGISPLVALAVAQKESGFNHCIASVVPISITRCNNLNYDRYGHMRYIEKSYIDPYAKQAGCPNGVDTHRPVGNNQKLCAYGMFQTISPPEELVDKKYPGQKDTLLQTKEIKNCVTNGKFNPFNKTQSACLGTTIMGENIKIATYNIIKTFGSLDNFEKAARLGNWVDTGKTVKDNYTNKIEKVYKFVPDRNKAYKFIYYYAYHIYVEGSNNKITKSLETLKEYFNHIDISGSFYYIKKGSATIIKVPAGNTSCRINNINIGLDPNLARICNKNEDFRQCMTFNNVSEFSNFEHKHLKLMYSPDSLKTNMTKLYPYQSYIFYLYHCMYNLNTPKNKENDVGWQFLGVYDGFVNKCGKEYMGCPPDAYIYNILKKNKAPNTQ